MARICATCREPVSPVNLCVCPDDDDLDAAEAQEGSGDEDAG